MITKKETERQKNVEKSFSRYWQRTLDQEQSRLLEKGVDIMVMNIVFENLIALAPLPLERVLLHKRAKKTEFYAVRRTLPATEGRVVLDAMYMKYTEDSNAIGLLNNDVCISTRLNNPEDNDVEQALARTETGGIVKPLQYGHGKTEHGDQYAFYTTDAYVGTYEDAINTGIPVPEVTHFKSWQNIIGASKKVNFLGYLHGDLHGHNAYVDFESGRSDLADCDVSRPMNPEESTRSLLGLDFFRKTNYQRRVIQSSAKGIKSKRPPTHKHAPKAPSEAGLSAEEVDGFAASAAAWVSFGMFDEAFQGRLREVIDVTSKKYKNLEYLLQNLPDYLTSDIMNQLHEVLLVLCTEDETGVVADFLECVLSDDSQAIHRKWTDKVGVALAEGSIFAICLVYLAQLHNRCFLLLKLAAKLKKSHPEFIYRLKRGTLDLSKLDEVDRPVYVELIKAVRKVTTVCPPCLTDDEYKEVLEIYHEAQSGHSIFWYCVARGQIDDAEKLQAIYEVKEQRFEDEGDFLQCIEAVLAGAKPDNLGKLEIKEIKKILDVKN